MWDTKTKTEIFGFYKMKTETEPKPNRNFCNGLVGLKLFFWFLGFLHTPTKNLDLIFKFFNEFHINPYRFLLWSQALDMELANVERPSFAHFDYI